MHNTRRLEQATVAFAEARHIAPGRAARATIQNMIDKPAGLGELDSVSAQIQSGIGQVGDLDSQIQALTRKLQGEANPSQADMIQLQSLMNKHNEVLETLSSAAKQRSDAMAAIVRNIR
jgi:hypothetical protein